ncbi:MAG: universal stress protein [Actinomycetota bacterium]
MNPVLGRYPTGSSDNLGPPVVLAAVSDSPLAVPVARWAGQIAHATDGEVVVFAAVAIPPDIRGMAGMGWIKQAEWAEQEAAAIAALVRPVLDELGVRYRVGARACRTWRGRWAQARQVAGALLRAARDVGADLVVIAHRPERRTVRSSVAARVLRNSPLDVLVVPLGLPGEEAAEPRRAATLERRAL